VAGKGKISERKAEGASPSIVFGEDELGVRKVTKKGNESGW
jgi:hypothetical protein